MCPAAQMARARAAGSRCAPSQREILQMTEPKRCGAPTKAGPPCRAKMNLSATNGLCLQHDPEREAERAALHAAGGKASRAAVARARAADPATVPKPPKDLEEATKYFAWLVDQGATGKMDARTVHECAFALKGFQSALEKRDLLRQIEQLRRDLAEARKEKPRPVLGIARG
jgi:hypothetical protein